MYLTFIFLNLICCILFLSHDFDIEKIDTPHVWEAILRYIGRLLKGFGYELHNHWKEVSNARVVVVACETPHKNISRPD